MLLGVVLEAEAHAVSSEHGRRLIALAMHDLADARDEVDVEVVREAAGGGQLGGRRADAACEADDANAVTSESLACVAT